MQNITMVLITLLSSGLFTCCRKIRGKEQELTLQIQPYTGNQLRVDGYYYWTSEDNEGNEAFQIFFLYRNGVILSGGFPLTIDLSDQEEEFANGEYYDHVKDDKISWGRFQISENIITYEKWYPSSGGPAPVYLHQGTILNDTTFQITSSRPSHGDGEFESLNRIYRFKHFAPKPDSTNTFTG